MSNDQQTKDFEERCSEAGERWQRLHEDIAHYIRTDGRMLIAVPDGKPPFSYTIGNQARGLPELLVIGTSRGTYLNEMSERMITQGRAFDHCEVIDTGPGEHGEKYRIKIVNASREANEEYTCQAGFYFGTEDYKVQQIILSDREGRFPGEEGCDPRFAAVTILAEWMQ
jgi:Domain of unknown function (DUF4262)